MTSGKAILVFCLSILAVQAYSNVNVELKSPVSELLDLFKDLSDEVQSAVNTALPVVSGLKNQSEADAASFKDKLNTVLIEATRPFIQQIEDAVAVAKKAGVEVSDCVGSSKDNILSLPGQVIKNISPCVTDRVNQIKHGLDRSVDDVNDSLVIVAAIGIQVKHCKGQSFVSLKKCVDELTGTISSSRHSIPLDITRTVDNAKAFVVSVVPIFGQCDSDNKSKAYLDAQAAPIVSDVTTCINNKMQS